MHKKTLLLAGSLLAAWAVAVLGQGPDNNTERAADRQAILESSKEFEKACAKGDAEAVAALWTERGEYQNDQGQEFRGRAEIAKAFAELFKEKGKSAIDIQVETIRFLGQDSALEEGILRDVGSSTELPSTTLYSVVHVREKGGWKIALAREWGAGQDRVEDLDWLVGEWRGKDKDHETTLTFSRDKTKPFLLGKFAVKDKGKIVSSGNLKIGFDQQQGRLRSWHFDDDGGHGQALWVRDGNRWVLDARGVQGDGTETASVNLLTRLGPQDILWRSIDRVVGERALPDTLPIRLKRGGAEGLKRA